MKIRSGFVSNSSSSSFIVGFPRIPKSVDDSEDMMFGKEKTSVHPYDYLDTTTSHDVAKRVFSDLSNDKRLTKKKKQH